MQSDLHIGRQTGRLIDKRTDIHKEGYLNTEENRNAGRSECIDRQVNRPTDLQIERQNKSQTGIGQLSDLQGEIQRRTQSERQTDRHADRFLSSFLSLASSVSFQSAVLTRPTLLVYVGILAPLKIALVSENIFRWS